ncbi:MAG: alkaline phosphatase family protein [Microbacteriaceae bacterium]
MQIMIPSREDSLGSLAEVIPSCFLAMQQKSNRLGLSPTRSAILVVVDGLGDDNLREYAGHARGLWSSRIASLQSTFPSTTAVAITTLTTGVLPGQHGMVGYRVRNPENNHLLNQLSGWGKYMVPSHWQLAPTLMRQSAERCYVLSDAKHRTSGFSQAVLAGAEYLGIDGLSERFARALELIQDAHRTPNGPGVFCYVYVSSLDQAAHKSGVGSREWLEALESIDHEFRLMTSRLDDQSGLLLVADHGVINVPRVSQRIVPVSSELFAGVQSLGGEPRCLQLYFSEPGSSIDAAVLEAAKERWSRAYPEEALVFTRSEAIDAGLFGEVSAEVLPRFGDLFVMALGDHAFYRDDELGGTSMVGQHGALSEKELFIPVIAAGTFNKR